LEAAIPWKLIDDAPWCRIYVVLERGAMNKNGRDDTSMADTLTQQYFAGLSKNTFLLACASLFADISTEMLYPVLPVFLTQTLNAGGSAVGLIDGVAQATQNIAQGFSGWLSDKLQKRKSIALAGYLLAAIAGCGVQLRVPSR
jgi:hypothetical protein